ncbi:basic leucine zipper 6-like [Glycine soja]|nr:basic leucine zipper 6-like [Glycine soja]
MENPKENNKVENHHTVNAILSPTFVFSATKLADQFGYAEGNPTPEQQILDPKLRRIFSNRFAAQRSREKKKNHLADLEIQKKTFENEIAQKQQLQDLYENKRQTQIVEEEIMYQEIDILKNYSMFKDGEIEKDKGEVIRERELQVIEQQEELQAQLVNLNIGPQECPIIQPQFIMQTHIQLQQMKWIHLSHTYHQSQGRCGFLLCQICMI